MFRVNFRCKLKSGLYECYSSHKYEGVKMIDVRTNMIKIICQDNDEYVHKLGPIDDDTISTLDYIDIERGL